MTKSSNWLSGLSEEEFRLNFQIGVALAELDAAWKKVMRAEHCLKRSRQGQSQAADRSAELSHPDTNSSQI